MLDVLDIPGIAHLWCRWFICVEQSLFTNDDHVWVIERIFHGARPSL